MNETNQKTTFETMELVYDLLVQFGEFPKNDANDIIHFNNGDNFFEVRFNCLTAAFWDVSWGRINVNLHNFDLLKTAVLEASVQSLATVLYEGPNEDGDVFVHTRQVAVFFPDCKDNADLIRFVFQSFQKARDEMNRLYFSKIDFMRLQESSEQNSTDDVPFSI